MKRVGECSLQKQLASTVALLPKGLALPSPLSARTKQSLSSHPHLCLRELLYLIYSLAYFVIHLKCLQWLWWVGLINQLSSNSPDSICLYDAHQHFSYKNPTYWFLAITQKVEPKQAYCHTQALYCQVGWLLRCLVLPTFCAKAKVLLGCYIHRWYGPEARRHFLLATNHTHLLAAQHINWQHPSQCSWYFHFRLFRFAQFGDLCFAQCSGPHFRMFGTNNTISFFLCSEDSHIISPEPVPIQILHVGTDIYQSKMVLYISSRVLPCDTLWYFQFDVFTCHYQPSHTNTPGRKDTNLICWFE